MESEDRESRGVDRGHKAKQCDNVRYPDERERGDIAEIGRLHAEPAQVAVKGRPVGGRRQCQSLGVSVQETGAGTRTNVCVQSPDQQCLYVQIQPN